MQKRGLSGVVTTIIIILLVVVAIGIIWFVMRGVIKEGVGGAQGSISCMDVDLTIDEIKCNIDSIDVQVSRGSDTKQIKSVQIKLYGPIESEILEFSDNLGASETQTKNFEFINLGFIPTKASVFVILIDADDEEKQCGEVSEKDVGCTQSGGSYSDEDGDGFVDYEDNCPEDYNPNQMDDDFDNNGNVCDICNKIDKGEGVQQDVQYMGSPCNDQSILFNDNLVNGRIVPEDTYDSPYRYSIMFTSGDHNKEMFDIKYSSYSGAGGTRYFCLDSFPYSGGETNDENFDVCDNEWNDTDSDGDGISDNADPCVDDPDTGCQCDEDSDCICVIDPVCIEMCYLPEKRCVTS